MFLFFMLLAAMFISVIEISECTANKRNLINVTEPEESDIWITGQTSYSIAWTQSKFSFKWDIALLDRERNKVSDISKGLSEFDDFKMTHNWLIPQSIQSGNYRIEICASGSPDDCGSSSSFSIRNSKGERGNKTEPTIILCVSTAVGSITTIGQYEKFTWEFKA